MAEALRVIGIDPGSLHMGWGVVDAHGTRLRHVASGTLHAPKLPLAERLWRLAQALEAIVQEQGPTVAAVENVFHAKNSRSALILGQARGAALVSLARAGLAVFEYTPSQIKMATTGSGRAEKGQVSQMVQMILGVREALQPDQGDALAAAMCHAQMHDSLAVTLHNAEDARKRTP